MMWADRPSAEGGQRGAQGALDLPHQHLPLTHHRVDGSEDGRLQGFLSEGRRFVAVFRAVVHPSGAAPHRELLTPFGPHAPAVERPALAADQPLRQGVLGAVAGPPRGGQLLRLQQPQYC